MPDENSVIDPDLPTYSAPQGAADDAGSPASAPPEAFSTPKPSPEDDAVLFDEDKIPETHDRTAAERVRALVDEMFPDDPGHETHNRPLAERVREFGRRLAEIL
jgi:hypothetical protein